MTTCKYLFYVHLYATRSPYRDLYVFMYREKAKETCARSWISGHPSCFTVFPGSPAWRKEMNIPQAHGTSWEIKQLEAEYSGKFRGTGNISWGIPAGCWICCHWHSLPLMREKAQTTHWWCLHCLSWAGKRTRAQSQPLSFTTPGATSATPHPASGPRQKLWRTNITQSVSGHSPSQNSTPHGTCVGPEQNLSPTTTHPVPTSLASKLWIAAQTKAFKWWVWRVVAAVLV